METVTSDKTDETESNPDEDENMMEQIEEMKKKKIEEMENELARMCADVDNIFLLLLL